MSPKPVQASGSWDEEDGGYGRGKSYARKSSSISYPGLPGYEQSNTPITSPPTTPPPSPPSTHLAPGPSRAQYPDQSARVLPRALSAPASFTPQIRHDQPLPPMPTYAPSAPATNAVTPARRSNPPQRAPYPPHPEPYTMGKWCWAYLGEVGPVWVWAPNVPPSPAVPYFPAGARRFVPHPGMVPYGNGPFIFNPAPNEAGKPSTVRVADDHDRWYWLGAWVPNVPPGPPPLPYNAREWAHRGPPPL